MQGRLMFLAGAALGYVLGAKAGRGRYEQLKTQADTLWHDPRVQEKVGQAQTLVTDTAAAAGSAVVDAAKDKAPDVQAKLSGAADAAKAKAADLTGKGSSDGDDLLIGSEPGSNPHPHPVHDGRLTP